LRIALGRLRRVPHRRDRLAGHLLYVLRALPKLAIMAKLLADHLRRRRARG
jgi:hypothetical protein